MNPFYTDYAEYLSRFFPNTKVQKISLNVGLSCPNRDGTLGIGGCTYCNNLTFNPSYCHNHESITKQLEEGKRFFARKYPTMKFLAYFQAYTNTYGNQELLLSMYREALSVKDVVGLIIGTRPDCISESLLFALAKINRSTPVIIEYGAESSHDHTLELVNRHHTWQQVVEAVKLTHSVGISCGLHLIAGLPGESDQDILSTIDKAVDLPIDTLKIHQLQIIKNTILAKQVEQDEISIRKFTVDEYIDLCSRIIERVPKHIAIERFISQSPAELLISPKWGLKNYEFTNRLLSHLNKVKNKFI